MGFFDSAVLPELNYRRRNSAGKLVDLRATGLPGGRAMGGKKNRRVLVVDDDQQFLDATRMVLEKHGYDVSVAHDGHEGLVRAETDSPDLIVLDVMMPRRSGFGVLDHLCRRKGAGPRVVVVTANEEPRSQEIAESKGADGFLHKPFEMRELLSTVDRLLEA
jgi:DNA-binding response OmpR family regulator